MEIDFYDTKGKPIAYTEDGEHIYLFPGQPVAYLDDESVYDYGGRHLGWLEDGWLRDHQGRCVFFTKDATGGPMKPIKKIKPVKGVKRIRPIKSVKQIKPVKSIKKSSWSESSGEQFFAAK